MPLPPPIDPMGRSCYGAPTLGRLRGRLRYLLAGARALAALPAFAAWLPAFAAWLIGILSSAALLSQVACGPTQFLKHVSGRAADAVAAAKSADAERYAPYEYTAASEYLKKAREEGAYASYQVAVEYGRRAEALAVQARQISEQKRAASTGARDLEAPTASGAAESPGAAP